MGQANKEQVYPYTFRVVGLADVTMCSSRAMFYIVPPDNALTIERLNTHLVMQFDAAIAAGDRILKTIGITDEYPLVGEVANYQRRLTINQAADGNRRIDINIDLTPLLKPTNIAYREDVLGTSPETGYTFVEITLPDALVSTVTVGNIELWKIDALYTTTGIR